MDINRKQWNERQKALRQALKKTEALHSAIELFMVQHGMLHAPSVSDADLYSFETDIWQDLPVDSPIIRRIPAKSEHSIVWCIWHLARIEDVTMGVLLSGEGQLFELGAWGMQMGIPYRDTGNAMTASEIEALSQVIDIEALKAYRNAVGKRTRAIVRQLKADQLKMKVAPERLQNLLDSGAVCEESHYLLDYWGGLTYTGLLLMPPTRHNLVHINEAIRLKKG